MMLTSNKFHRSAHTCCPFSCSGELTSKRRERVGAESRSQALRSELRRAVGHLSVQLEQHTLSLLNMPGKEHEAFTAALKQVESVRGCSGWRGGRSTVEPLRPEIPQRIRGLNVHRQPSRAWPCRTLTLLELRIAYDSCGNVVHLISNHHLPIATGW